MQLRRFPWVALALGVALGVAGGLAYAWFMNPVEYIDVAPSLLNSEDQQAYVLLTSLAYAQDGDLARARARIEALGTRNPAEVVAMQADASMASGADATTVRALTNLAVALGGQPLAAEVFAGTPVVIRTPTPHPSPSPTVTPTPTPTFSLDLTPLPLTFTPSPTPITGYELVARDEICSDVYPAGQVEVYVYDALGNGVPGVEVSVQWADGEDHFFTGMKPEVDIGYGDFEMTPDGVYTVTLVNLSEPVVGLAAQACYTESDTSSVITYRLVFGPVTAMPTETEDEEQEQS